MARDLGAAPELLAPAGGMDAVLAAVAAGADAVYIGAGDLNARAAAIGFTLEETRAACAFAHARGVRVYAALNVLVTTAELGRALALARDLAHVGVDALIVADIGLARLLARELPKMELHLSTQAGAASLEAVALAARELGMARVTLARELSMDEIARIAAGPLPVEVFCHGAICISYSGACAASALTRGRSAMRGDCTQPCRQAWRLVDGEGAPCATVEGDRLLCPRDHMAIHHLRALVRAGVASLKIEGRMKNPDYVYNVVSTWREALDAALAGARAEPSGLEGRLGRSFNRGFTDAYLRGSSGAELMSFERSINQGWPVGEVVARHHQEVEVALSGPVDAGDTLEIRSTPGADAPADVPKRWPMVPCPVDGRAGERIRVRCKRKVEVGSPVHVVKSARVLAATERMLAEEHARLATTTAALGAPPVPSAPIEPALSPAAAPACSEDLRRPLVIVETAEEARRLRDRGDIDVGAFAWRIAEEAPAWEDVLAGLVVVLDETMRPDDAAAVRAWCARARRVVCRNLGEVELARAAGRPFEVAAPVHVANAEALAACCAWGAVRVWLPDELAANVACALAATSPVPVGCLAAGAAELMVTEHCALTCEGPCDGRCATCARRAAERHLVMADGRVVDVRVDARGRARIVADAAGLPGCAGAAASVPAGLADLAGAHGAVWMPLEAYGAEAEEGDGEDGR